MKRLYVLALMSVLGIAAQNLSRPSAAAASMLPITSDAGQTGELSVMTYNVKGLPFPTAYGRVGKLAEIGERLGGLRRSGRQPHIVLLQEAFIPEAKAIASAAGYTYVALGPKANDAVADQASIDKAFAAQASWLKGEGLGKWVDSGLVILSDYPIVQTRRMAFPADMCAGFDCLAAKGVLLAWVKIPGRDRPVAIADTHLNSRRASGVAIERADMAYLRQVAATRAFIRRNVPSGTDLIFGGDFNVGHARERIAAETADGGIVQDSNEATSAADRIYGHAKQPADLAAILIRAKDKEYFRSGTGSRLRLRDFEVPFGLANGGSDLSDHLGYVASYSF